MVHTTPLPCRHHHHGHDLKGGSVWEWGLGCCDPSFPRAVTLTQKALCLLWALSDAGEEPSFFFFNAQENHQPNQMGNGFGNYDAPSPLSRGPSCNPLFIPQLFIQGPQSASRRSTGLRRRRFGFKSYLRDSSAARPFLSVNWRKRSPGTFRGRSAVICPCRICEISSASRRPILTALPAVQFTKHSYGPSNNSPGFCLAVSALSESFQSFI